MRDIIIYYYNYILYRMRKESAETHASRRSGVWSRPRLEDTLVLALARARTPRRLGKPHICRLFIRLALKNTHGHIIHACINMPPILYDIYMTYVWRDVYNIIYYRVCGACACEREFWNKTPANNAPRPSRESVNQRWWRRKKNRLIILMIFAKLYIIQVGSPSTLNPPTLLLLCCGYSKFDF